MVREEVQAQPGNPDHRGDAERHERVESGPAPVEAEVADLQPGAPQEVQPEAAPADQLQGVQQLLEQVQQARGGLWNIELRLLLRERHRPQQGVHKGQQAARAGEAERDAEDQHQL